ncbi:MAG: energy transducer TonB, partial [Myxococcales bacterium FL481]
AAAPSAGATPPPPHAAASVADVPPAGEMPPPSPPPHAAASVADVPLAGEVPPPSSQAPARPPSVAPPPPSGAVAPPAGAVPPPDGVARAAEPPASERQLQPPVLTKTVEITYPADLATAPEPPRGSVVVSYVVGVDGIPKEVALVARLHPALDALAIQAVSDLRYQPARYGGHAVEVTLQIEVPFNPPLAPDPEPAVAEAEARAASTDKPPPPGPPPPIRISGVLKEAGQRVPVEGASVIAVPGEGLEAGKLSRRKRKKLAAGPPPAWTVQATTDAEGQFELRGIPDGSVRLIFVAAGYERQEHVVVLETGDQLDTKFYQVRDHGYPYRTTVVSETDATPVVTRRKLSTEEIATVPGTQGDALRSVQSLPGVTRPPFGAGLLMFRGSDPDQSIVQVGHHNVPYLYHFGVSSVVNTDLVASVDTYPGNFDSRYGDALGGVVDVRLKKGRRDGYHGYLDADAFDATVLAQGPIGKGSFIISGRRSYVDAVMKLINQGSDVFSVYPRYYDYQAVFDHPLPVGELSVRAFGADDRLSAVDEEQASQFTSTNYFHRGDVNWTYRRAKWRFLVAPAYARGYQSLIAGNASDFGFTNKTHDFYLRGEAAGQITDWFGITAGVEANMTEFDVRVRSVNVEDSATDLRVLNRDVWSLRPSAYATLHLQATPSLGFHPGVRAGSYLIALDEHYADPRLTTIWDMTETTRLTVGAGMYTQAPEPREWVESFGNPDLDLEHALHTSLGIRQKLPRDVEVELNGYYKRTWDLAAWSDDLVERDGELVPEVFDNTGIGRIMGGEVLIRKRLTGRMYGWLAYTLQRSELRNRPGEPFYLHPFDQTHNLIAVASYKLPRNWRIGARFRLTSGIPEFRLYDGVVDAASGSYWPLVPPTANERVPAFHQLDVRVDKTWTWKLTRLTAYVDVTNAYNKKNAEFFEYSFDYRQRAPVNGLPIFPSFGLKLEF